MKIIFIVLFVVCLFKADFAVAQAEQSYEYDIEVSLVKSNGEIAYTLTAGIEQIVVTPVGKYLRKVTFKISEGEEIMELANPFQFLTLTATGDFDGDGVVETLVDRFAILTKSGNLKFVYHNK